MKVALMQMYCEKGEVSRNLARTAEFVECAAVAGADLVCFPEMSVTGFVEPQKQAHGVLGWDDPQLTPLFELSKRSHMTLVVGIAELNPGNKPLISQGVIRRGELLGVYRKINIHQDEVDDFSPGVAPHPATRRCRYRNCHMCRYRQRKALPGVCQKWGEGRAAVIGSRTVWSARDSELGNRLRLVARQVSSATW